MSRKDSSLEDLLSAPLRFAAAMQNAAEMARLGRLGDAQRTPYEVALRDPVFRLRHYTDGHRAARNQRRRPAVVLVPPLMITAEVYDVAPTASAVRCLMEKGVDPWVVDFGAPERQEGGLRRTLTDHVLAVSRAIDHVREASGQDVHLAGYSQGGMFCYQAAAYRRTEGLASVITFGSPVDVRRDFIPGMPEELAAGLIGAAGRLVSMSFAGRAVPAWLSRNVFKLLSPTKEIRNQLEFLTGLHDRESVLRREGQRRFLATEGWVAWPGPALRDFLEQFVVHNRLFSGGFVIEGRTLALADITCPVLTFVGEADEIARAAGVRAIREAAPKADVFEVTLPAGHFGLVVGSRAMSDTWPVVVAWMKWREGGGRKPGEIVAAEERDKEEEESATRSPVGRLTWGVGRETLEVLRDLVGDGAENLAGVLLNVFQQLPRVARLEGVTRDTRIGLGLALAEQAVRVPDGTFFLYSGRAHTYADANRRVDAVVRGLISVGVRQGDHVGLLMNSRPSALALSTAISRLGAVAVFLRPDGDLEQELALGEVEHLIADPDHAAEARAGFRQSVLVLGGGAGAKDLPEGCFDMESIDPARVALPEWYEASPGRSEEIAFILFSGRGPRTRASRITNRRWALSAYGTASAAAMTSRDTVYCWTPIHHPSGLLVSISGALVGGARLALANGFSAESFWQEVRRYGATVVFYTGTMCRELVDAPFDSAERNHPVRLFAGSGMPRAIWRRLVERFGPVSVLEFYAATEANAILGNLSGAKIGSVGRPIPGSSEVAIAAYDPLREEFFHDASGFCRPVVDGEVGLLLARVDRERGALVGRPLRNVFEKGDAWYATGDLFRRDSDGDYWLVDHVTDVIRHNTGALPSIPIEEAVWEVEGVSAAAAYGLQLDGVGYEIPVVAVVLRPGVELDTAALLERVERDLDPDSRPVIVRAVDEIPMTAGYRMLKQPLRTVGIPTGDPKGRVFWLDAETGKYRRLDAAGLESLKRSLPSAGRKTPSPPRRPARKARRRR